MIRLRGFIFLVFTSAFLFGISAPQLHADDWTKVKMTSENIQQLAGLNFASQVHSVSERGIYDDPHPPRCRFQATEILPGFGVVVAIDGRIDLNPRSERVTACS